MGLHVQPSFPPLFSPFSLDVWGHFAKGGGKEGYACMQAHVNNNIILLIN